MWFVAPGMSRLNTFKLEQHNEYGFKTTICTGITVGRIALDPDGK